MIDHLQHRRPRAALQLFLSEMDRPSSAHTATTLEGLTWIFFLFREPLLALEAVSAISSRGYLISTRLASKCLRSSAHEILFNPDRLVDVLGWIRNGIARDAREAKPTDPRMIETTMDAVKRMGRTDWAEQVFRAYRASLEPHEVGHPRIWAAAIAALAAGGDITAAQLVFNDWRTAHFRLNATDSTDDGSTRSPPEQPYLALLNHFAVNSPPLPVSKDPAYLLLKLMQFDKVRLSDAFLNALLRTELSRKRFSSFWGLWNLFDLDVVRAMGIERDSSTWKLAVRAKLVGEHARRQRGRLHNSPVLRLCPVPYVEAWTPSSRDLFARLLATRLDLTSHRPSLRLSTKKRDPIAATPSSPVPTESAAASSSSSDSASSANLLNSFLSLFLSYRDFAAAQVVLETFAVHRIEPNAQTHATVVLAIVKLWEKGKVDRAIEQGWAGTWAEEREKDKRYGRRRGEERSARPAAVELIRTILERRKMRVSVWSEQPRKDVPTRADQVHASRPSARAEVRRGDDPANDVASDLDNPVEAAPDWMVTRELRDTSYLVELLRRSSGLDEAGWERLMKQTRNEILPTPKDEGKALRRARDVERDLDGVRDGDEVEEVKKPRRKITRGSRYRHEAFGTPL
ncbi:hypothetical protein JCM10212_000017 [Sporobolomyces blumeae]